MVDVIVVIERFNRFFIVILKLEFVSFFEFVSLYIYEYELF